MFEQLSGSAGNVLGFKINENTTDEDIHDISGIISETIGSTGKLRLLIEIEGFRHMEPEALLEKLRFVRDHAREIERMAVLSNRVWIKSWVKIGGLLTHTEVEHFDRSEMEAAWQWVRT
ncbi:MAG: STAS/SEC14 domain-containing protein [Syntrophobacteraceae bacterium]